MILLSQDKIFKDMVDSIVNLDEEIAIELANKAIKDKMNLMDVIEKGYAAGIRRVGELWEEGEYFP